MKGVFVVGAGPAGMFAARKLALAGYETFIFNRDIRPGGLAQYGIYPLKAKMKTGLRKQFDQTLALPNVHYFGHVQIGESYDLSITELESFRPAAIVFASGAQGAKKLGLSGEDAIGVYAAKDFVYYYNQLESHVGQDFSAHRHIAVVGVGNVAIDVARWLLQDKPARTTESVTIVARRGPLEVKFDSKEIAHIDAHIDRADLVRELERVRDRCARVNQNVSPEAVIPALFPGLSKPDFAPRLPRLSFRFLSSPKAILPSADGRVTQVVLTENELVLNADSSTSARATAQTETLDVDTVLFAIGDRHDPAIGLPMGPDGYSVRPSDQAGATNPAAPSYEVWDTDARITQPGRFVVGWARKASTGLAGLARHDGEAGAQRVSEYLAASADPDTLSEPQICARLRDLGIRCVGKQDLKLLARAEERRGPVIQPDSFHFCKASTMFQAIDEERVLAENAVSAD
ncbi:MAG TPA: FAD-dependent oxidoreductase [Terracidiphilus sp.]|jgi:ferredoxin--NADP+ reductase|nr:FAD-dependent oxidoreductase [Terracidiphilus sp.]